MTERLINKGTNGEFWVSDTDCTRAKGKLQAVMEKLYKYETAEDEGRLVVFPCRVGDVVYAIEDKYYEYLYHKGIQKGHVCRFEYDKEWFAWIHIDGCNKDLQIAYKTSNFNQTVFLTKEEAEKALKEMEGKA